MSLAREDALHRIISLRDRKIQDLERKLKRRKSYKAMYYQLLDRHKGLHRVHIQLMQRNVDLQNELINKDNLLTLLISRR